LLTVALAMEEITIPLVAGWRLRRLLSFGFCENMQRVVKKLLLDIFAGVEEKERKKERGLEEMNWMYGRSLLF